MALLSIFDKFVRSFDDTLKLKDVFIPNETERTSKPLSPEELAQIIQKKPSMVQISSIADFKLWHIPASKLEKGTSRRREVH